jgi:hypothetical protein
MCQSLNKLRNKTERKSVIFWLLLKCIYILDVKCLWRRHGLFLGAAATKNSKRLCLDYLTFWYRSFTINSNKSPTWCNNFSVYYPNVCFQLNMFRMFSSASSGAQWLQWQPLVLPWYCGENRAVFVAGPAGPITNTARLSPRYEGKTKGGHCSHWAPDDGRENAGKMLRCKQTSG